MTHSVQEGSIFLRKGTPLPLYIETPVCEVDREWSLFEKANEDTINTGIKAADWHLFSLINPVHGMALHPRVEEAVEHATCHALRKVDKRYNAAEVTHITVYNLGLFIFA